MNNVDPQYLGLLRDIILHGVYKETRSGSVYSVFGRMCRFNLNEGLPILTTKKVFTRGFIEELLWFLRGETNIRSLVEKNVNIWNDDAYRHFQTFDIRKYIPSTKFGTECEDGKVYNFYIAGEREIVYGSPVFILYHNGEQRSCKSYKALRELTDDITKEEFLQMAKDGAYIDFAIRTASNIYGHTIYTFGDLGPVYGAQWRGVDGGVDQIARIIETLKTNPNDRRLILSAWNVNRLEDMALPPCHYTAIFNVMPLSQSERLDWLCNHSESHEYDEWVTVTSKQLNQLNAPKYALNCMLNCRSQDVPLGTVSNWVCYAILTHMIAQCVGMAVGELIWVGGDCHIYENQVDGVKEQLQRDPQKYSLPRLWLNPDIKDIDDFTTDDIKIVGYESYPAVRFPLSVG